MLLINRPGLILLTCGLLALRAAAGPLSGKQLKASYTKLEEHLSKHSRDQLDLAENMRLIKECHMGAKDQEARLRLYRLTTLTTGSSMCLSEGYAIIKQNLRLTKGLPRLRTLVKQLVAIGAQYCEPKLANLYHLHKPDGLRDDSRKWLLKLTSRIAEQLTGWNDEQMSQTLMNVIGGHSSLNLYQFIVSNIQYSPKYLDLGKILLETTKELDTKDIVPYIESYPTQKATRQEDQFTASIIRHTVEPCSSFVQEMTRQKRFQMAQVFSRVLNRNLKFVGQPQLHTTISDMVAYYTDWIRYEICRTYVLRDDQEIHKTIDSIRAKELNYDPKQKRPDSHHKIKKKIEIQYLCPEDFNDDNLFEANE